MPFTTDIDGGVSKGETKELEVVPKRQNGTFFTPQKLDLTVTFSDGTTTSKSVGDFSQEADTLVVPIDFPIEGLAEIVIEAEDKDGNVERLTPEADGAQVLVR